MISSTAMKADAYAVSEPGTEEKAGIVDHTAAVELPFELPTPFYGVMLALWQLRPDLQKRFPLQRGRQSDYLGFLAWCFWHGRRTFGAVRDLEDWNRALNAPINLPHVKGDRWGRTFTVGMYLAGLARSQYRQVPISRRATSRQRVFRWYWRGGRHELGLETPDWQLQALSELYGNDFQAFLDDLLLIKGKQSREEEITEFGVDDVKTRFESSAKKESVVPPPVDAPPAGSSLGEWFGFASPKLYGYWQFVRRYYRQPPSAESMRRLMQSLGRGEKQGPEIRYPFGVNLFGYAHGELGIGEDVRMLALTLEQADIPFCVINVQLGDKVSQKDESARHWVTEQPRYGINIFCMTGIEYLRSFLELDAEVFAGRYTIGQWPWELPSWPTSWEHVYSLVDEIWGISEYTSEAYRRAPVPVTTIPLPVTVEPVAKRSRKDFGLPEDDYLFVFSFDMLSTATRKNPAGLIDAFHRAFPMSVKDEVGNRVGLVLKINHPHARPSEWRKLEKKIAHDSRIHIIEGTLRRPEVLALYQSCDCFVSLHRSEGFGRSLVESLMLGLDVIATGYSGSMDYSQTGRVRTVDYELIPVKKDEYFLPEGQHWAEPNLEDAARHMRELASVVDREASSSHPFDAYRPDVVSMIYKKRLEQIYNKCVA